MTTASIEHVNLTVRDPEATAALLERLFGWKVRWNGPSALGGRTVHVGNAEEYVALYTHDGPATGDDHFIKGRPFNHVGITVGDLDAVEDRVKAEGLTPFSHGDYEPGRRFYFLDPDGIEYEIVSYA